jgi:hypothetical protein
MDQLVLINIKVKVQIIFRELEIDIYRIKLIKCKEVCYRFYAILD